VTCPEPSPHPGATGQFDISTSPGAIRNQYRLALPRPRRQAPAICGGHPRQASYHDEVQAIEKSGHDAGDIVARIGYEREPFEIYPGLGRGERPQSG
jgi:hypothetical protein